MRLKGQDCAWAIGDCARIVNAFDGRACPPTGQFAQRQGRQVADNIVRAIHGRATRPFSFKPLGQLCAIGGRNAVAEIGGIRVSGFAAWFLWRGLYLMKLPSWSRRVKVGADWLWDLVFPRDLVNLKTDATERVSRAYFRPGDYVFREGDPALNFYAVEKGTLEVVRSTGTDGTSAVVAVLGPGDFFGEMALVEGRARSASVRARTAVEVTTLGAQVFSRVSKSLAPLQQRLAQVIRQRSSSIWTRIPEAYSVLSSQSLARFLEPAPRTLRKDATFAEVLAIFANDHADTLYIVDDDRRIEGVLTRTDLMRAVDLISTLPILERNAASVQHFMSRDPMVLTLDDSPTTAAMMMRDRGLKNLPVVTNAEDRRVVGCVRTETMMHMVLQELAHLAQGV
jgi:NADH dehydrogenase